MTKIDCLLNLQDNLMDVLEDWEALGLLLAAAGHDVGHKGKTSIPQNAALCSCSLHEQQAKAASVTGQRMSWWQHQ